MQDNLEVFGREYLNVTGIKATDDSDNVIRFVNTSDADATSADMLNAKTAYVNGTKVTGNIPSLAAQTITPSGTAQIISAGSYLSGDQTIAPIPSNYGLITWNGAVLTVS